jgi:hypothetical protein
LPVSGVSPTVSRPLWARVLVPVMRKRLPVRAPEDRERSCTPEGATSYPIKMLSDHGADMEPGTVACEVRRGVARETPVSHCQPALKRLSTLSPAASRNAPPLGADTRKLSGISTPAHHDAKMI